MTAIIVLAVNFVREQRLIFLLMSAWMISISVLFAFIYDPRTGPGDIEVLYRQELAYGIAIALFSGASLVHAERKNRRILAVLSKGIYRAQYLAAVALGIACTTAIYYGLVFATNQWLIHQLHFHGEVLSAAVFGWIIAQLAAVVGLAFGTFLHPFFASGAAGLLCAAGMWIPVHPHASPVSYFLRAAVAATYEHGLHWNAHAGLIVFVAIETAIAFTIAVLIFERRDITVPVE